MSSPSAADLDAGTRPRSDPETMRSVAMIPLLIYAVLTQLDAVGNRLSGGSPIGTTELTLAAALATGIMVLMLPTQATPRARGTTGARLVALLFCWAVFSWTLSDHRDAGVDYLKSLITAIAPALCVLIVADTPRRITTLIWAIIGAGAVSAAIVVVESRTGTRIVSTSIAATTAGFEGVARSAGGSDQNPTTAAQMLLVSTALALGLLGAGSRRWWPVLAGVAALGTLALILGSARSAILGLLAAVGLIALSFRGKPVFPLLIVGGLVAMVAAIPFLPPTLVERFTAVGDFGQDQTLYRRISYLRIGADLIAQSPLWGVGPGNFPLYYVTDAYRWMPGRELFPRELHNTYLDTAAEYGLVGLLIFAALLSHALLAARRAARSRDPVLARAGFAIAVALAALLVACFFMPHKNMRYLWLLLALAIQCGRIRSAERTGP